MDNFLLHNVLLLQCVLTFMTWTDVVGGEA
jgi:hypothetical protein